MSVSKEWSVGVKGSLSISLDLSSSGSGSSECFKSLTGGGNGSGVGVKSLLLGGVLSLVVTEGGLPASQVTWERSAISSSGARDLISELGNKGNDLLNGSTIAGLSEHGEGVDERKVGGVLTKSPEFLSNFF